MSIASPSKVCPAGRDGQIGIEGRRHGLGQGLSKPLKTDSRMIIAATGMATAATLSPAIRLMTERDLGEKR